MCTHACLCMPWRRLVGVCGSCVGKAVCYGPTRPASSHVGWQGEGGVRGETRDTRRLSHSKIIVWHFWPLLRSFVACVQLKCCLFNMGTGVLPAGYAYTDPPLCQLDTHVTSMFTHSPLPLSLPLCCLSVCVCGSTR